MIAVAPLIWKGLCALLVALLLLQNLFFIQSREAYHDKARPFRPSQASNKDLSPTQWRFKPDRDADNHALSFAQCDTAFPDLYYEIDRAVTLWQDRNHTITPNDTEISWRNDAAFRLLIHDNHIRILETRNTHQNEGYRTRTQFVLHQLYRALQGATAAGEKLPSVEIPICVDDQNLLPNQPSDTHAIWSFTRRLIDHDQNRAWLMPDFNFWAWPPIASSFGDMRRKAREHDALIMDKIPKAVWRGAKWTNEFVRGSLLNVSNSKPWSDIQEIDWDKKTNLMKMEDFCKYAYVVHTEGRSWSGRLKYLLNCDSVPIIHELDWTTEFYHLLEPSGTVQNYIPVKRDFSDLEEKVEYYAQHPEEAQVIADNAVATFRNKYTTPAAEACYWRRMIAGWNEVAAKPELYETVTVESEGKQVEERQMRGITFEEWITLKDNHPPTEGQG